MPLPDKNTANTETAADLAALNAAANAKFIAEATNIINNAIAQGQYAVSVTSFAYCDLTYLANYFGTLGYSVTFPDELFTQGVIQQDQPAQLFGQFWTEFWLNNGVPPAITNPARMIISWF